MATQVIGARKGVQVKALLVVLVLAVAVVVLATQARSLWPTTTGSREVPASIIGPNPIAGHAPARFSRPGSVTDRRGAHDNRSYLAAMGARKAD